METSPALQRLSISEEPAPSFRCTELFIRAELTPLMWGQVRQWRERQPLDLSKWQTNVRAEQVATRSRERQLLLPPRFHTWRSRCLLRRAVAIGLRLRNAPVHRPSELFSAESTAERALTAPAIKIKTCLASAPALNPPADVVVT